ncbi:response regulator transcription factor [Actinomadura vinacea]|uniref:Response regulator transcription factor n=1 Tax=Actinomadura vinacea TaxID=115336 RepID=A0ABN3JMS2_9ACTN
MIKVLVAEDMHLVRGALIALLEREDDLAVVAEVGDGAGVVPAARVHRPDVAVLDIGMPGVDGLEAAARIAAELPGCRVLMVTGAATPAALRRALAAGAAGFMVKDAPPRELADAIRRVAAGEQVIDQALAVRALTAPENPLTDREVDVLRMAASGAEPAEIAATLHLSRGTVRNYLGVIVGKLGARNRLDAVRIAAEAGWL